MAIANNADQYEPEEFRDKCFRGDDGLVIYDAVDVVPERLGGLEDTRALLEPAVVGEVLQFGLGCVPCVTEVAGGLLRSLYVLQRSEKF